MITNIQSLRDKSKNFAIENNLSVQQVLQNYMFERFLVRLSKSKYKDKFIIKGGLLLSSIMGINMGITMEYQSRHSYAENIEFQEAVNAIIFIYNEIIKKVAVTID